MSEATRRPRGGPGTTIAASTRDGAPQFRGRLTFGHAASVFETFLAGESDELVTRATQTGATVRKIEDPELLRAHGGVAAALRFRI